MYQTFPMSVNVASSRSVANTVNVFFNNFTNLSSSWNFKFSYKNSAVIVSVIENAQEMLHRN